MTMVVGVAVVEIHVHESQSLKAKRGVVRSICGRLRSRFNASVGEVGGQGTWQRAVIGISMTGSDETSLRRAVEKAVSFVEETHLAQVLRSEIEMIRLPLTEGLEGPCEEGDGPEGGSVDELEDLPWSHGLDGEASRARRVTDGNPDEERKD